jgi:hypothetical protein
MWGDVPEILLGVAVAGLTLAVILAFLLRGPIAVECPGCKKKGGVIRQERKWIESKPDRTVYNDCFRCQFCGCTYYVTAEEVHD